MTREVITSQAGDPPKKETASRRLITMLGSTDKSQRDKAVSKLRKLLDRKKLSSSAMLKLWQGLWECFWLSDKPLVQQALAADLADMQLEVDAVNAFLFLDGFVETMMKKWIRVDSLRRDKFIILQATFLHRAYKHVAIEDWDKHFAVSTAEILDRNFKKRTEPNFVLDVLFCNLDKLKDVVVEFGPPSIEILQILLGPFYNLLCSNEPFIITHATEMFQALYDSIDPSAAEKDGILKSATVPSNFYASEEEMSSDEGEGEGFDSEENVSASSEDMDDEMGSGDDCQENLKEDKPSKMVNSGPRNSKNLASSPKDATCAPDEDVKSPTEAKDVSNEVSKQSGEQSFAKSGLASENATAEKKCSLETKENMAKVEMLDESSAKVEESSTIIPDSETSSRKAEESETITKERKNESSKVSEQSGEVISIKSTLVEEDAGTKENSDEAAEGSGKVEKLDESLAKAEKNTAIIAGKEESSGRAETSNTIAEESKEQSSKKPPECSAGVPEKEECQKKVKEDSPLPEAPPF